MELRYFRNRTSLLSEPDFVTFGTEPAGNPCHAYVSSLPITLNSNVVITTLGATRLWYPVQMWIGGGEVILSGRPGV